MLTLELDTRLSSSVKGLDICSSQLRSSQLTSSQLSYQGLQLQGCQAEARAGVRNSPCWVMTFDTVFRFVEWTLTRLVMPEHFLVPELVTAQVS